MTERSEIFILSFLGLCIALLLFATIITTNMIRLKNVELNTHILEDCKIDYEEYKALNEEKF